MANPVDFTIDRIFVLWYNQKYNKLQRIGEIMEFEIWFNRFLNENNISKLSIKKIAEIAYHEGFFDHQRNTPILATIIGSNSIVSISPEDERPLPDGERFGTDEELESFNFKEELEKQKKEDGNELE